MSVSALRDVVLIRPSLKELLLLRRPAVQGTNRDKNRKDAHTPE